MSTLAIKLPRVARLEVPHGSSTASHTLRDLKNAVFSRPALLILVALILLASAPVSQLFFKPQAAAVADQQRDLLPLSQLLKADGTLDLSRNFNGSLDARGWALSKDASGAPRFIKTSTNNAVFGSGLAAPKSIGRAEDGSWDNRFGIPGPLGGVSNMALAPDNSLYIATGGPAGLERFANNQWGTLANGVDGTVYTVAITGTTVYVGGVFESLAGSDATRIAKWDGATWSSMGSITGFPTLDYGYVYSIAPLGNDVYVAGSFTDAGSTAASNIARWDGAAWHAVGYGLDRGVNKLAVHNGDLYAVGIFAKAGNATYDDTTVNGIAKWNGSVWSALGSGFGASDDPYVADLAWANNSLYAVGEFSTAGGVSVNNIARWDGVNWSAVGAGLTGGGFINANVVAADGSNIYVGGSFTQAGNAPANHIARWDGSNWATLGSGVAGASAQVNSIIVDGGSLYVGGAFTQAGGLTVDNIARWDGANWNALPASGSGVTNDVAAVAVLNNNVYIGGGFNFVGAANISNIARWDGSQWHSLASGLNGSVSALAVSGNDLYVGGGFSQAGGVSANNIARWDGVTWHALGGGVTLGSLYTVISAIAVANNNIYVGGRFTQAGGVAASNIARWDGSNWYALGSGINHYVYALAASGGNIYATGQFSQAGGVDASSVAMWNGASWQALGAGLIDSQYNFPQGYVVAVRGNDVFVGGVFDKAGAVNASSIAKWDGSAWSALGAGVSRPGYARVDALAFSGADLFVGGIFTQAGGVATKGIARWDGAKWSALGGSVDRDVNALAADADNVYVGGRFLFAGGNSSLNFAIWRLAQPIATPTSTPTNTPTNTATATPTNTATSAPIQTQEPPTASKTSTQTITSVPTSTPKPFSDVAQDEYFYAPVQYLTQRNIISGYNDGTFRPYNNTTRGQLAKIVVLGFAIPTYTPPNGAQTFSDIAPDNPLFVLIETAAHAGLISGYSDHTFRPGADVTRGQLSKIVVSAAKWPLVSPIQPTFLDVDHDNTFYGFVETAVAHNIISGYDVPGGKEFRPGASARRGQIAKIVFLALTGQ